MLNLASSSKSHYPFAGSAPLCVGANNRAFAEMRSVPPRGSGWVVVAKAHRKNKRSRGTPVQQFDNRTHPLPRGGTDLISASASLLATQYGALPLCR